MSARDDARAALAYYDAGTILDDWQAEADRADRVADALRVLLDGPITDAQVEAAAEAVWLRGNADVPWSVCDREDVAVAQWYRDQARAALEAARDAS